MFRQESEPNFMLKGLREGRLEVEKNSMIRPFGDFSRFVCTELGIHNAMISQGMETPDTLFREGERLVGSITDETISDLQTDQVLLRCGLIDLLFMLRSLDVAYLRKRPDEYIALSEEERKEEDQWSLDIAYRKHPEYVEKLQSSTLFLRAKQLAVIEGISPVLQWTHTARQYPNEDPRSFMPPGPKREQEVALYITNKGADAVFESVVAINNPKISIADLHEVAVSMAHLSRMRHPQHFAELAEFSGPSVDGLIPASGGYSVWHRLALLFFTNDEIARKLLLNPKNIQYFDVDGKRYIDSVVSGEFKTLPEIILQSSASERRELSLTAKEAAINFNTFQRAHKGAVSKHAADQLNRPSPSDTSISNKGSMDRAIESVDKSIELFDSYI